MAQTEYMWKNKGKYCHPGGVIHAGLHGFGTFFIFFTLFHYVPIESNKYLIFLFVGIIDFLIHYHVDWIKVNINNKLKLTTNDPGYWAMLGLDQLLHSLTYVLVIYVVLNYASNNYYITPNSIPVFLYSLFFTLIIISISLIMGFNSFIKFIWKQ